MKDYDKVSLQITVEAKDTSDEPVSISVSRDILKQPLDIREFFCGLGEVIQNLYEDLRKSTNGFISADEYHGNCRKDFFKNLNKLR